MTRARTRGSTRLPDAASETAQPTVAQAVEPSTATTPPCSEAPPHTPPSTPSPVPTMLPVLVNTVSPTGLTLTSLGSSDTLPEVDGVPSTPTPLYISLLHSATKRGCCTAESVLDAVAKSNNPRPMRNIMGDSAEYWAANDGTPLHLRFLASLDLSGQFSKIGAYFNLSENGIELAALKKVKAQFELRPLEEEDTVSYPPEAIECSQFAHNAIITLCSETETNRNKGLPPSKLPNVIPFYRTIQNENRYCLVVHSEPLFRDLPNAQASTVASGMTLASLSKELTLMSPSKAKAAAAIKVKSTTSKSVAKRAPGARVWSIFDMPDPAQRYKSLYDAYDLKEVKVVAPNIRDRNGTLIHAGEYEKKLQDGDIVEVDVIMKLWSIRASGSSINSKDPNGSHIYQLILQEMKLMPYDAYVRKEMLKVDGGGSEKRKADDEPSGQSPTKKGGSSAALADTMDLDDDEVF